MLELAQQLAYYISVVDNGATSKLVGLGQQLASISIVGQTAQQAVMSILNPLNRIGSMWSQREQQINNITRSLRQYGYVGQSIADINKQINDSMPGASQAERSARFTQVYRQQFQEGREMARGTIATMTQLAAVLPGEVDDYMQSFSMNLAHVSKASGMTTQRAAALISTMTASSLAAGIDKDQAARDLMQFMTIGPQMRDRSWAEVWANYARDPRTGARIDQNRIHGMNANQRVAVLEDMASQMQPMMDATGDSFEAIMGTFNSAIHEFKLAVTEPIFDQFKLNISAVNAQLGRFMGITGQIGHYLADRITPAFQAVTRGIDHFDRTIYQTVESIPRRFREITPITGMISRNVGILGNLLGAGRARLMGVIQPHMEAHGMTGGGLATSAVIAMLSRYVGLFLGPWGALATAILSKMFLGGELNTSLVALWRGIGIVLIPLLKLGSILYRTWDALTSVAAALAQTLLPLVIEVASVLLGGAITLATALINVIFNMIALPLMVIVPAFIVGITVISNLLQLAANGWQMIIVLLGAGSSSTMDFIDGLKFAAENLRMFVRSLQSDLNWLLHNMGIMSDEEYTAAEATLRGEAATVPQWYRDFEAAIRALTAGTARDGAAGRQPPANRPHTNNDFRYSRFDITQRFADGMDPDRVASAFAEDISSMAENRLQSGFQPAFTTHG